MNNKRYEKALEAAENTINSFKQSIPDAVRQREKVLFQKITGSGQDRLTSLEILFSEMDVIYSYVHNFTICKKGCSYCCQLGISVSQLEVEYIIKKLELNKSIINSLDSKCLFLTGGICSIYDFRPFSCRRHLAFYDSPEWCEMDISPNHRFPNIDCTEIDRCYAYLTGPDGRDHMQDIRQAFRTLAG
jgi:uncharacterized protein